MSTVLDWFPSPPQSSESSALGLKIDSYSPPPVISLGEEWSESEPEQSSSSSPVDYFAYSPASSAASMSPEFHSTALPPWHEEHARLLSIRDAVLDSEREARDREARLESQVVRIKEDLARVKEARARALWAAQRHQPPRFVRRASDSDVASLQDIFDMDTDMEISTESALASHLSQIRTARAEERRKRRKQHERIRELGVLLTLGTEVRQWEERLAWSSSAYTMELDDEYDSAWNHLSSSLPTTPAASSSLPSLSASPLWRVSAEMILRRRSLSERPRRSSSSSSSSENNNNNTTPTTPPPTKKSHAVPPPIAIPAAASVAPPVLRSAPVKPSALKSGFTFEDLLRAEQKQQPQPTTSPLRLCDSDSDSDSDSGLESDDSRQSSDDASSSVASSSPSSSSEDDDEAQKAITLRRGRSRWSWRRSLQSTQQHQAQLQQLLMEVDDA